MAFHFKDNWFFERFTPDGDVRILHGENLQWIDGELNGEFDTEINIDVASWASIVASVSKLGETAGSYQRVIATHQGDIS